MCYQRIYMYKQKIIIFSRCPMNIAESSFENRVPRNANKCSRDHWQLCTKWRASTDAFMDEKYTESYQFSLRVTPFKMVKYYCILCGKTVSNRHHGIQCDICDQWQHRLCNTGKYTAFNTFPAICDSS